MSWDWKRFKKTVAALVGDLVIVGTNWAVTGDLDVEELRIGVTGLVGVALVFFFRNSPASEAEPYETQDTPILR